MEKRISQLDPAVALDLTDNAVLVVNVGGVTKQTTWGELRIWAGNGIIADQFTLTSAEILLLNTTPCVIAPAEVGVMYRAISLCFIGTYGTVSYAGNTTLQLQNPSATMPQMRLFQSLNFTINANKQLGGFVPSVDDNQFVVGEQLELTVPVGDPTTGDGLIDVYVLYQKIYV